MAGLQDALMMSGPNDVTTGDVLANAPQKSVWRMLMETARNAQIEQGSPMWWGTAPVAPMRDAVNMLLGSIGTGASGADNIRRGSAEDDPLRIAGGVGEIGLAGLSVLPATGALGRMLMGTIPRAMGTTGALMGASMLPGVADARDRREGEVSAIQGPAHLTQERDLARQQLQEMMMQQRLINEQHKRSGPETQRRALAPIEEAIKQQMTKVGEIESLIRAHAEQEHAKIMAERPLRERSPEAVQAITLGGGLLAAGFPLANTVKHRFGEYLAGRRLNALADEVISGTIAQGTKAARPSIADTAVALGQLRNEFPARSGWADIRPELRKAGEVTTKGVGMLGNSIKGAMVMGEASALPEQIDYLTYGPGHPTREAAAQAIRNPDYWKDRMGPAALGFGLGTIGQGLGHLMTPGSAVNQSRINTALGLTKPAFTEDMAAIQRVRDAAKNPRTLIPEPPVGPPIGPSGTQGPQLPATPTGATGQMPTFPPQPKPPRGSSEPWTYEGSPQQQQVHQAIAEQVGKGKAIPTIDELRPHLIADGKKKPVPRSMQERLDNLTEIVTDLKTIGTPDNQIADFILKLMQSSKHMLPAIAAGTMGVGAMNFGNEPQQ